jgi:uncharacterized membrane protein YjjP (DUF1212 family)/uncharacterized membrane protein YjjB (DUF3815 family)
MRVEQEASRGTTEDFIIALASALHAAGTPAHRLEEMIEDVTEKLGHKAVVFSTPTMLMLGFGPYERQRTVLLRVSPVEVHLGRLDGLDHIARCVVGGVWTPGEGKAELEKAKQQPQRQKPIWLILTWLLLSATSARFFGGGLVEMGVAAVIGAVIGALAIAWPRLMTGAPIFELLGATVAAVIAGGAATLAAANGWTCSSYVAMLSGVVGLLPGFTLTVAVTELATRHLASGTARATAAATTLLQMAVGVALGGKIAEGVFGKTPLMSPEAMPSWTELALLAPAAAVMGVFCSTRKDRIVPIVIVSALGFYGARLGAEWLGPELGAAIGAFVVGLASRVHGALGECPQFLTLVPATLLLVPGSFGFRSVSLFLGENVTSGLDAALRMLLIAMSISAGLLVAQSIGRTRPGL